MPEPNQNINMSGTEYSNIFLKKEQDFNRYIQEMEMPINRLDLYLAAKEMMKDEKGDDVLVDVEGEHERMNKHGREYVKSYLRTFLSPNTYMSAVNDREIDRLYDVEIQSLQDDLYPRIVEFGCSKNDVSAVYSRICSIVYMALKKARGDKEAIFKTMSSTNIPQQQQQSGGGLFSLPPGWKA